MSAFLTLFFFLSLFVLTFLFARYDVANFILSTSDANPRILSHQPIVTFTEIHVSHTCLTGAIYLELPITETNPLRRISRLHKQAAELKKSLEPIISRYIMELVGLLPSTISQWIWNATAYKVSCSMSNLPGPTSQISIFQQQLKSFVFFVPPQGTIGLFLTIMSYNGLVTFGAAVDRTLIQQPERLLVHFREEIETLSK
eukprot:TRINITY_DN67_c0_g2_i1.p1 TRINITY_DN67_c0_g2~~TRINITY_DN67_c0_g2_i1.p1  ORF type:complete len:200 (-),score=33.66 TRINITY_DN67_c0_g2_i1:85-684(-)